MSNIFMIINGKTRSQSGGKVDGKVDIPSNCLKRRGGRGHGGGGGDEKGETSENTKVVKSEKIKCTSSVCWSS